jgi:hypothetical protein
MAHEAGHYLGLFHPIELSNGQVVSVDPLTDTDECSTEVACVANPSLFNNLMYPNGDNGAGEAGLLTPQQRGVLNLQVLVD